MAAQRFVQLYTWWITPGGVRQFCVVEKTGKHLPLPGSTHEVYQTTQIKLLEVMNPAPVTYDIEKFFDLVDRGKLIEYIPGVTDIAATKPKEVPWYNPDNAIFETQSNH